MRHLVIAAVILGIAGTSAARSKKKRKHPELIELAPVAGPESAALIAELRALAQQKFWYELLTRLEEVPEDQRGAQWTELLGEAAIGYLAGIAKEEDEWTTLMTLEEFRRENSVLKKHRAFMRKRAEVGIKGFENCFATTHAKSSCAQKLVAFAQEDPDNGPLALAGARMAGQHALLGHAVEMFALAVKQKSESLPVCRDGHLWNATNWALQQPSESVHTMSGRQIAFKHCFEPLQALLMAEFVRGNESYARNTCDHLLKRKRVLSRFQSAWCRDLLEGAK